MVGSFLYHEKTRGTYGLREVFETDGRCGREWCSRSLFQDTYHIHFINTDSTELFLFLNNQCTDYSWASMTGTRRSITQSAVTEQTYRPLTDSQHYSTISFSHTSEWKIILERFSTCDASDWQNTPCIFEH